MDKMEIPVIMFVFFSLMFVSFGYLKGHKDCTNGTKWYE